MVTNGWETFWSSTDSDEVLVNESGSNNATLEAFWRDHLALVSDRSRVIDVACGAGSVLRKIHQPPDLCVGVDVSISALRRVSETSKGAATVVADCSTLPFPSQSFDFVFSQFGVEYAGIPAFLECSRLLAPGGVLKFLVHCKESAIQRSVARDLATVQTILRAGFFDAAKQLTQALSSKIESEVQSAAERFNVAEAALRSEVPIAPTNFAGYAYLGYQKLLRQWNQYDPSDVLSWLTGMQVEAESAAERLSNMQDAALDDAKLTEINTALSHAQFPVLEKRAVAALDSDTWIAWELSQCI